MLLHDRQMYCVAGGESPVTKDDPLGALEDGVVDGQYFIDYAQQRIKRWLNGVAAIDSNISVKYFLEYFCIGDQTLAVAQQLLHPPLRVDLMRMGSAYQVHRNVGVDKNHHC